MDAAIRDMKQWSFIIAGLFITALAGAWLVGHALTWRRAQTASLEEAEIAFARRQYRRRTITSTLLLILGLTLLGGAFMEPEDQPLTFVVYWLAVVGVTFWAIVLAGIDAFASHSRIRRLQTERLIAAAKLRAELNNHKAQHKSSSRGE